MRNKVVLILIGFLVIISLVCLLWGNSLISWSLENTLQTMIGAKVEIEGFRFNPFQLAVQMEEMQITNPADTWKNLISAKKINFKLAPEPLFEGKTVIDQIVVEDLVFNEKRRTDGKLKRPASAGPVEKEQSKLSRTIATMPILKPETIAANLDPEKLTASYQFKTDLSAARIKGELDAYQQKWDANLEELSLSQVELEKLEEKIFKLKKPNSLPELQEQLALVKEIRKAVAKIRTQLQAADVRFQKDNQGLTETIQGLRAEAEADYQALLALAELPDLGHINYAEALLGKTIFNTSTAFLNIIDHLRESLPVKKDSPAKVKQKRGGQDIVFPGRNAYPGFLIKKIVISGRGTPGSSMDGFYAKGMVTGITSEPSLYGLPLTMELFAQTPQQALLRLDGEINHVIPDFQDQIKLSLEGLPLPQLDLGDSHYLPAKILTGEVGIEAVAKMVPDHLKLEILLSAAQIKTDFSGRPEPKDLITEIVRDTFTNLKQITLNYELVKSNGQYEMKISSNLNRMLSERLTKTVGEKVTSFNRDLRAKVDGKLHKAEKSLEAVKHRYQQTVAGELNEFQERLKRVEQKSEAKQRELEEKKKDLEKAWQNTVGAEEENLKEKMEKELNRLKNKLDPH